MMRSQKWQHRQEEGQAEQEVESVQKPRAGECGLVLFSTVKEQ